jgi:hypothetical protein
VRSKVIVIGAPNSRGAPCLIDLEIRRVQQFAPDAAVELDKGVVGLFAAAREIWVNLVPKGHWLRGLRNEL